MKRTTAVLCALTLLATAVADARPGGGGGRPAGGARPSGGMSRPAPSRPAPSRPAQMPSGGAGGFSGFNGDFAQRSPVNPPGGARPSQPINKQPGIDRPAGSRPPAGTRPPAGSRPPVSRPPIPPRVPPMPSWGWNGGAIWVPAPYYYGGGFWGPYAFGFTTAIVLGSVADAESKEEVKSYKVAPESPGAKVLEAYQLQQVECKPEGLVVIFGPEQSVVCATPNEIVSAGQYDLNVDNLTIYSKG